MSCNPQPLPIHVGIDQKITSLFLFERILQLGCSITYMINKKVKLCFQMNTNRNSNVVLGVVQPINIKNDKQNNGEKLYLQNHRTALQLHYFEVQAYGNQLLVNLSHIRVNFPAKK